jgi:hypothetical protein
MCSAVGAAVVSIDGMSSSAGYKESNYQGDDRRNTGYCNNNREDSSSNRQFQPRGSREHNQSPDDMLNEPCHMHYAYIDDKKVS